MGTQPGFFYLLTNGALRLPVTLIGVVLIAWHGLVAGQERVGHALGDFEYIATSNGILIAAPHGTFDSNSATIAVETAKRTGAGYVVAWKFTVNKIRINVNRPTEGASLACSQESRTERAQNVYEAYSELIAKASSSHPLRVYVEIHGNANPRTARHIEIATVGVTAAQAQAVKDAYPLILSRVRERFRDFPELLLRIEPVDKITYAASCAKKLGTFSRELAPLGIHVEFPRSAREGEALQGSAIIVDDIVRRILGQS